MKRPRGWGLDCGVAWIAVSIATGSACGGVRSAVGSDDAGLPSSAPSGPGGDAGFGGTFKVDSGAAGNPIGDAGCAVATADAKRQPAYLMFVLDGSDSMRMDNKWAAVVPALSSIFDEMATAADPGIGAGLIIFPGSGGPYPAADDVPLAFVDAAQKTVLDTRLMAKLSLGTPTEAALKGGYGELETFQPKAPLLTGGKKVLVLITDGVPTDDCSKNLTAGMVSTNACVALAASKLSEMAPIGPIETFVVGVGDFPSTSATSYDPVFLGNVAKAGGTGPASCNPDDTTNAAGLCYFEVDPSMSQTASDLQQKFVTALDAIRGQVISCTFPLQSTGLGTIDPALVNVEIDGQPILQDPANGWTYDDPATPTAIVLNGSACASAKGEANAKVSIVVGCATQAVK